MGQATRHEAAHKSSVNVVISGFFRSLAEILFKCPKNVSHFGRHVQNGKLVTTVTASFNTITAVQAETIARKFSIYRPLFCRSSVVKYTSPPSGKPVMRLN